jgi:hypothetical protein
MKINQNDLIFSIVFLVLGLGFMIAFWFMKPVPPSLPEPTPVNLAPPALPASNVAYANSLPGGSAQSGPGGGGGFGAPGGGMPPGMMGPGSRGGAPGGGKPGGKFGAMGM